MPHSCFEFPSFLLTRQDKDNKQFGEDKAEEAALDFAEDALNNTWSHGVMVSTLDSESSDPSSNLGGTLLKYLFFCHFLSCLFFFTVEVKTCMPCDFE